MDTNKENGRQLLHGRNRSESLANCQQNRDDNDRSRIEPRISDATVMAYFWAMTIVLGTQHDWPIVGIGVRSYCYDRLAAVGKG